MIQAIEYEQTFVTNLEKFMGKADKFIKIYYSGMGEESHLREMMLLIKNLAIDADLQQENNYQKHCDSRDLIADSDD
jgi:hypothetical protein